MSTSQGSVAVRMKPDGKGFLPLLLTSLTFLVTMVLLNKPLAYNHQNAMQQGKSVQIEGTLVELQGQVEKLIAALASANDQKSHDLASKSKEETSSLKTTQDQGAADEYLVNGYDVYKRTAESFNPTTDKVTTHTYQIMYGRFLLPYYQQKPTMKMLEIGLGCDMNYGPGASVALYKKLFPKAELWEAEYNGNCVEKSKANGKLEGIHALVGDQANESILDSWIEKSGGDFDVIIDDGGHTNCQIWHSFQKLWPTVKPGGLYFIEDMQVAKNRHYRRPTEQCSSDLIVPEKLKDLMDNLIYDTNHENEVEFMFCQSEACVLGKKLGHLQQNKGGQSSPI